MNKLDKLDKDLGRLGPNASKLLDINIASTIKTIILTHWQIIIEKNDFFPAPQPVSLERRDISKLVDYEYFVCAKSDGIRYLFVFLEGISYLVDRAFNIYIISMKFKEDVMFILDGELIYNNNGIWQYIVHDCINSFGKNIMKEIFPIRYNEVDKIKDLFIRSDDIILAEKLFFDFKNLSTLKNLIDKNKLGHKTDGVIFTPKYKKIGTHTQHDLFKWKPINSHTFDFKITKSSDGIKAYANKNGEHILFAQAVHGSSEEQMFIDTLNKNCPEFKNNCIVECVFNNELEIYEPIKIRGDKTHPNSLFTIQKTLVNIKENITLEELVMISKKI